MSNVSGGIRFVRKAGRVIPIRGGSTMRKIENAHKSALISSVVKGGIGTAGAVMKKPTEIEPNQAMRAASLGISVGSGFMQGLGFGGGARNFIVSHGLGIGADVGASALTVGAWKGKGQFRARAKGAARDEAINQVAGHGVYLATILARPAGRAKVMQYASKVYGIGKAAAGAVAGAAGRSFGSGGTLKRLARFAILH